MKIEIDKAIKDTVRAKEKAMPAACGLYVDSMCLDTITAFPLVNGFV